MNTMADAIQRDRFKLSPRKFVDAEWFGLDANLEGTINVPFEDPYQALPYPYDTCDTSRKEPTIMAGETTITVVGNLTTDPELRFTPVSREFGKTEGTPVANFTVASTPRTFDQASNRWADGDTLFLRASAWREMAENVAASLTKGSRVVVSGRIKPRTYETKAGEKRTVIELEVDEIGLSLRYRAATPKRIQGSLTSAPTSISQYDDTVPGSQNYTEDDPWFGKDANRPGNSWPGISTASPRRDRDD